MTSSKNKKKQSNPQVPASPQAKTWQWWIKEVVVPILLAIIPGYFLLLAGGAIENPFNKREASTATIIVDSPINTTSPTPPQAVSSLPVITRIPETSSFLITATPATVLLLSPSETVIRYFEYLNDKEYSKAWGMFSIPFKMSGKYSGIEGFKDWASDIDKVEVIEPLTVLEESDTYAVVEVFKVIYYTRTGTNTHGLLKFYLSRSQVDSEWEIDAIGM